MKTYTLPAMNAVLQLLVLIAVTITGRSLYAQDNEPRFVLDLELGAGWQARNDVQIPNDSRGTRFALDDLAGDGPWPTGRLNGLWRINDRHGLRVLLAPLSYTETGTTLGEVKFAGQRFDATAPIRASYQFNSWRISYRYHLVNRTDWDLWLGGTLKIRDAEIRLRQGQVTATDDDLGVVPLFYLASRYRLTRRWSINAELDALAGGPGRAIDLGLRLDYDLTERWRIGLGYRGLEGGADTDDVYNFAWFNSAVVTAGYRF